MRFLRPLLLALTLAGMALAITFVISTGISSAHTGIDGGSHHEVSAIQTEGPQCDADGRCSHGPDPAPPGVDPATVDLPEDFTESAFAVCDGNGSSGKRVQVLYVRASDRPDQFALYENSFRGWAAEGDHIYQESARVTGGVRYLRFVHDSNCRIDVLNVTVSPSGDADFWALTGELKAQGFTNPNRKYLVFLDSNHPDFCGQADVFADDSPDSDNLNNTRTGFAVIYNGCWSSQVTIAHELGHNLGAVQRTSPNASRWDHCIDEWDVMCYDDGSGAGYELEFPCKDQAYNELLDCNNDDYFHTNPPSGNWLRTHWNIADSGWLGAKDARIELSLETGYYNTVVSAQLTKFTPGQVVTLRWPDMSVLATITADSQGRGSASFRIPLSPYGSYTVLAKDASGMSATDLIDVRPRMTLSQPSSYPGEQVRVTLYGYEPDDVVEVRWSRHGGGYDVIASIPIADNGRGTQIVQIPYSVEVGSHTIRGAVPDEIQWSSASFTLLQTPWTVTLDKSSSKYNGVVNATLSGFAPNSPVTLRWPDGATLVSGMTNGSGGGVLSFRTPLSPLGDYA
ncbi:MAG: hypothetical protein M3Y37_02620, partial [Chloroflexota bacterium]|nr:hypothetical protein [Chloroflexota bacterium]